MNVIVTHLWSSTLVLLVALAAVRVLPLTARTRHAVLLCALFKFAIPAAVITTPLRWLGIDLANIGRPAGAISMQWLGGPVTLRTMMPQPASRWPQAVAMGWMVPAAALAIGWAIARRRLVSSALRTSHPALPRERAALADARRQLGLRTSVEVTRSSICEAPAVVRIIRPVVVLPDGGCDALDDDELESLLRHECAHVARRDNLVGLLESAIVSVFWFHPLVWIAQRALSTAREEACDETAAATADAVDTYISALSKICRAVLASRLAGVSCMASAHLQERLNHIMRYELLRTRALSHRLVMTLATIAVLGVTIGGGLHAATSSDSNEKPFKLNFYIRPGEEPNTLAFFGRVIEVSTDHLIAQPNVIFPRGSSASTRTVAGDRDIQVEVRDTGSKVSAVLRVSQGGVPQQESTYFATPQTDRPRESRYTGALISLNLKAADIKDVLKTFAKITGTDIQYPPSLEGKVTLDVKDMPWDEAFDLILREQHLTWEANGKAIVIKQ